MKIKVYTDLKQSKELAKILPIESADMVYLYNRYLEEMYSDIPYVLGYKEINTEIDIPCWSLAALLDVLPKEISSGYYIHIEIETSSDWCIYYEHMLDRVMFYQVSDNLVDACYELILKLHEQNLL